MPKYIIPHRRRRDWSKLAGNENSQIDGESRTQLREREKVNFRRSRGNNCPPLHTLSGEISRFSLPQAEQATKVYIPPRMRTKIGILKDYSGMRLREVSQLNKKTSLQPQLPKQRNYPDSVDLYSDNKLHNSRKQSMFEKRSILSPVAEIPAQDVIFQPYEDHWKTKYGSIQHILPQHNFKNAESVAATLTGSFTAKSRATSKFTLDTRVTHFIERRNERFPDILEHRDLQSIVKHGKTTLLPNGRKKLEHDGLVLIATEDKKKLITGWKENPLKQAKLPALELAIMSGNIFKVRNHTSTDNVNLSYPSGWNPLTSAIYAIHTSKATSYDVLEYLISLRADVNQPNGNEKFAIVESGRCPLEVTKILIEASADLQKQDVGGENIVTAAAANGNLKTLRYLKDIGYSIDCIDGNGRNALCAAAFGVQPETVHWLLDQGAKLDPVSINRYNSHSEEEEIFCTTPLQEACFASGIWINDPRRNKIPAVIEILLSHDINGVIIDFAHNWSPLTSATDFRNLEIVDQLIKAKANVNGLDKARTPLSVAVVPSSLSSRCGTAIDICDSFTIVKKLLRARADPNLRNINNWSPLCTAIAHGNSSEDTFLVVKELLNNSADPNSYAPTPIVCAAKSCFAEVFSLLIEHKADPNMRNGYGRTALSNAVYYGDIMFIKLVLKYADVSILDHYNGKETEEGEAIVYSGTALEAAVRTKDDPDIVQCLVDAGLSANGHPSAHSTPLIEAIKKGKHEFVQLLLSLKADPNKTSTTGLLPLSLCARLGDKTSTDILLSQSDINMDLSNNDDRQHTPLIIASLRNFPDIIQALLKAKANLTKQSKHGYNALTKAAEKGHISCLRELLNSDTAMSSINKVDKGGFTALFAASSRGNLNTVKFLLDAKADPNFEINNMTAFSHAMKKGRKNVADYLKKINPELGKGQHDEFQELLKNCTDINKKDSNGLSLLLKAAKANNIQQVRAILSIDAILVDQVCIVDKGRQTTALIEASIRGWLEIVKELVEHGADANLKMSDGLVARDWAVEKRKWKVVRYLNTTP